MARTLAYIVCGAALLVGAALVLVTLLLTLAPPYAGITGVWELGPLLTLTHFRYYLARSAILNTLLLSATVLPMGAALARAWQRLGIAHRAQPLLLVPLLMPGPVIALLWRPIFAPWLELGDTTLNLLSTGLVLLWRSVPLLLLLLTLQGRAWRMGLGLAAVLILLDGGLPLLLSGGAPLNATHTWASWILQQLWTNRAWGHAAHLSTALALAAGMTVWLTQPHDVPCVASNLRTNRLGAWLGFLWIAAPFLYPLWTVAVQPSPAGATGFLRQAALWLLNSASVTLLAATFTLGLTWAWTRLPHVITGYTRAWVGGAVMLPPLWTVSTAYLADRAGWTVSLLSLALLLALAAAALSMGIARRSLPTSRRAWIGLVVASTLLVQAQSFALQLVLGLPPDAWTATLGLVWTQSATPSISQAWLLLLHGALAAGSAWLVLRGLRLLSPAASSPQ